MEEINVRSKMQAVRHNEPDSSSSRRGTRGGGVMAHDTTTD